ncbi:uncharacterized protein LOC132750087 [Ruditapes philippinarum]|uniref:uncharacterized protein LOC132738905 n=1 Tax=Ruditapes philippinarum TaxID=129788 RepID=UPI00295B1A3A|nr:uncharacterized protein LOC132738905 [Ruditapes philippinarum]XP_060596011.1 uncharacterized protein LOC132750087 [Ruditapes philippinarum]
MNQVSLAFITTLVTYCLICSDAFYINDDDETPSEPGYRDVLDLDTGGNAGLRKLLLKKLRFRDVLKEHMKPPEEILENTNEAADSKARHKAAKRHQMEDLMSRVQQYISHMKERQIKESMSLPSLRFGRSGINWKDIH